jgi:hypothetical protein
MAQNKIEMKQTVEEAAYDYATNKTKFRKDVLKEVDADTYVSRHADSMEDFQCGAEWQSKQSPWISVKERLPEKTKYDWVLVIIRDKRDGFIGLPQIGELRSDGFWHTRESDDFNTEQFRREYGTTDALGVFLHQEVLAWLPIPSFDDITRMYLNGLKKKEIDYGNKDY